MSESCLSQKISLCRCIETLNDDECLQVIRLLQHYQKYEHLNQLLVQIIMKITSKMNVESLEHIYNEIKQISCNNKYLQTQTHCADNKSKKVKSVHQQTMNMSYFHYSDYQWILSKTHHCF